MAVSTIISVISNIGVVSVTSKLLSAYRAPISKHVVIGACETVGIFFAASMAGDAVGKYAKEQIESFKNPFKNEDKTGTDEKESEDAE